MMTESEVKMYSDKYAKMREHSVFILGGDYFNYDQRNDLILRKFKLIVESKSGFSVDTKDPREMQCLRFLAMRELAYRTEDDGVRALKIGVDDAKRKRMCQFEEMAENPYVHHPWGIFEKYHNDNLVNRTLSNSKRNKNGDKNEAAPTIN